MKTTKGVIAAFIIIFYSYSACYAQKRHVSASQWIGLHKKSIEIASYIFEGTVIKQSKSGEILTCTVIQITKIFKGSPTLKLGTIKVITDQNRNTKDGDPGLGRGRYIIFGRTSASNVFDSIVTDNTITLSLADISIAIFGHVDNDQPVAQWGGTLYKTLDELYAFFKENGLKVEEQTVPADSTKH